METEVEEIYSKHAYEGIYDLIRLKDSMEFCKEIDAEFSQDPFRCKPFILMFIAYRVITDDTQFNKEIEDKKLHEPHFRAKLEQIQQYFNSTLLEATVSKLSKTVPTKRYILHKDDIISSREANAFSALSLDRFNEYLDSFISGEFDRRVRASS
ncbi:MAG: hypothetical protein ABIH72_01865 [archaeon]